jgi:hypothetical protein
MVTYIGTVNAFDTSESTSRHLVLKELIGHNVFSSISESTSEIRMIRGC